jgi:hypothetical protein
MQPAHGDSGEAGGDGGRGVGAPDPYRATPFLAGPSEMATHCNPDTRSRLSAKPTPFHFPLHRPGVAISPRGLATGKYLRIRHK